LCVKDTFKKYKKRFNLDSLFIATTLSIVIIILLMYQIKQDKKKENIALDTPPHK